MVRMRSPVQSRQLALNRYKNSYLQGFLLCLPQICPKFFKVQTGKLAAGCSKHCFGVADRTNEVSSKHVFEVVDETDEVSNHTYGKATLTKFEEIFEEYKEFCLLTKVILFSRIVDAMSR